MYDSIVRVLGQCAYGLELGLGFINEDALHIIGQSFLTGFVL